MCLHVGTTGCVSGTAAAVLQDEADEVGLGAGGADTTLRQRRAHVAVVESTVRRLRSLNIIFIHGTPTKIVVMVEGMISCSGLREAV
jgi:hypothetical protein